MKVLCLNACEIVEDENKDEKQDSEEKVADELLLAVYARVRANYFSMTSEPRWG